MAYTQTQGYGSRLFDSIKGVLVGIVLFALSFPLLWWNEGRAVQTAKSLAEGATNVVSVTTLDPSNEAKLVHYSGQAVTTETLADHELGISAPALRLHRKVEMYQWKEESHSHENTGGSKTTTYTYSKEWSSDRISSSSFKEIGHDNPSQMPLTELHLMSSQAKLGPFDLSSEIIKGHLDKWEAVPVEASAKLPTGLHAKIQVEQGGFYLGADPSSPAIGDCKITYRAVKSPLTMSIVAKQVGSGFTAYPAKAGDDLLLTTMDQSDAASMFKAAEEANEILTWILRAVGWFLMTLGIFLVLRPIAMVANFIPFAGSAGSFGAFLLAAGGASGLSLGTVAVAWIVYRPLLGIAILVLALAGIVGAVTMMAKAKKKTQRA